MCIRDRLYIYNVFVGMKNAPSLVPRLKSEMVFRNALIPIATPLSDVYRISCETKAFINTVFGLPSDLFVTYIKVEVWTLVCILGVEQVLTLLHRLWSICWVTW